ncbi:MAG: dihydroorotate dehydrogenase-like protein [Bacteroidales bacterium]|nr:dihydroorotate dehydrogenase-like protein [Bacteroidales bacterium]
MADLSTSYMGLKLRNPIIAGSSGLTNSIDDLQKLYNNGAGAIVLKSLFEEQINFAINKTFNQSENNYSYPEALDYISHYTRENDLENYIKLIRDAKSKLDIPVIGSINCVSSSEWVSFAKNIQEAGADALELNIFILPSDPRRKAEQHEQIYFDILQSVMKQVKIPIAAKISYYFSGLTNMALQLSWTGISGLVLFNRFFAPDFDIDKFEVTPSHVFSTPAEMSLTLRWVALLSDKIQCDIAASTGIHDGEAVIKQLLAGAKAVQIASVLYQKGFEQIGVMLKDIEQWMEKHQFVNTADFIGKLSYKEAKNPAAFERVQFMKHVAGIE